MILKTKILLGAVFALVSVLSAKAVPYNFTQITANGGALGVGAQLSMDVTSGGGSLITFTFRNVGALASSITDVYFDNAVTGTPLLSFASIANSANVFFEVDATPPNLPSANSVSPSFTADFSADSGPPVAPNGVNNTLLNTEFVGITLNLAPGINFNGALQALNDSSLRVGIKVQGYANGESETFVNTPGTNVPEGGATLALLCVGLLGLHAARRRLLNSSEPKLVG